MKRKILLLSLIGGCALTAILFAQDQAADQNEADLKTLNALVQDLESQQKTITDNQTKMEEKMAAIAEELRQARIYSKRGGGKTP